MKPKVFCAMERRLADFTDIKSGDWIDRKVPEALRPYARLARLDRPIGSWLLFLPCAWGVALASRGWPNPWFLFLFALGSIIMRGAGCVINDLYDRDLDARVERTRARPLASGAIKPERAIVFLVALLLIGFGILSLFNRLTMIFGVASLVLVFTYPYMKRITWWPQLFLGFTFNWGALLGWTAVENNIGLPAIALYSAGIFWTLGYDTIYAHQDSADDALIGIKSTARLFGAKSKLWVALFYALALLTLVLVGWIGYLDFPYYIGLAVTAAFAIKELFLWRIADPENCLQRFRRNRDFGLLILFSIMLGRIL
jgi:4-hydroxybenzoate polyprenyltransferase